MEDTVGIILFKCTKCGKEVDFIISDLCTDCFVDDLNKRLEESYNGKS